MDSKSATILREFVALYLGGKSSDCEEANVLAIHTDSLFPAKKTTIKAELLRSAINSENLTQVRILQDISKESPLDILIYAFSRNKKS